VAQMTINSKCTIMIGRNTIMLRYQTKDVMQLILTAH
jgi:hypothetical protein